MSNSTLRIIITIIVSLGLQYTVLVDYMNSLTTWSSIGISILTTIVVYLIVRIFFPYERD